MITQTVLEMQQSRTAGALPGCWQLAAGRAVTLRPREAGVLRISQGRVWATVDGPHRGLVPNLGDHVLGAGQHLTVRAGQRLVLESWDAAADTPAWFSWDAEPAAVPGRHRAAVVQPLGDLRLALGNATGALVRLVTGVAGLATHLIAGDARSTGTARAFGPDAGARRTPGTTGC